MGSIVIGSRAIDEHFPRELGRDAKDLDFFCTSYDIGRYRDAFPEGDIFSHPSLDDWIPLNKSRVATVDELYTIKLSHIYWELKNGSWEKHLYDLRFLKRNGAVFDPSLHSLLYRVWEGLHGPKRTNLAMEAGDPSEEVWKEYPHNNKYSVSSKGKVRGPYGLVAGTVSSGATKYRQHTIDGKSVLAHKLVMDTFVGPCPEGMEVRHLDGDGLNNNIENLMYGTQKENAADKERHGTNVRHEKHPLAKLTQEKASEIRQKYAAGDVVMRTLADEYGVAYSLVQRIIKGQSWKEEKGFFDDAVERIYIHDSIHESVAYGDEPMYARILRDGSSVDIDPKKLWALSHQDLVLLFREEVNATALERIVIPRNYRVSPGAAYRWALRRTITSLTKGKSATFIADNFEEFAIPDDYLSRHLAKKDRLVKL